MPGSARSAAKRLLWNHWRACNDDPQSSADSVRAHVAPDIAWRGPHPLHELTGAEALIDTFWQPFIEAFPDLQRRPYLFLAGAFEGADWVCATGDFLGTFARDWLGVPASGTSVHLRFGEFCRIEEGRIVQTYLLFDLLELIAQSGYRLLPPSLGRELWVPGPIAGGGLLHEEQDESESAETLALIEAMIFTGLNNYDGADQASMGLERYWHRDMVWHGPSGIGSAYGLEAFKRDAQRPIITAIPDRKGVGHRARIAEGMFAASTGWPSLGGSHQHPYLDLPASGQQIGWNIMDFWRRDGERLLENWNLIDLLDVARQSGVDLLARLGKMREERER